MIMILLLLALSLLVAGLVAVYVAYPHRGEEVPRAPWLGEALTRGRSALPMLTEEDAHRPISLRR